MFLPDFCISTIVCQIITNNCDTAAGAILIHPVEYPFHTASFKVSILLKHYNKNKIVTIRVKTPQQV